MAGRRVQQPASPADSRRAAALRDLVLRSLVGTAYCDDDADDTVRTPGWRLAYSCCMSTEFDRRTADQVADELEPILVQLSHEGRLPYLDELHLEGGQTLREAMDLWTKESPHFAWWAALGNRVRLPFGSDGNKDVDPLEDFLACLRKCRSRPPAIDLALCRVNASTEYASVEAFGPDLVSPRRAGLRRFLAVSRELSVIAASYGADVFFLPLALLADRLHADKRTVSSWRAEGVDRGFLEMVDEASDSGGPNGRAATYRWTGVCQILPRWIGRGAESSLHSPFGDAKGG